MCPVILDDSSVGEYHVFLHHWLLLWAVALLDCHEQLLHNNGLFTGNKTGQKLLKVTSTSGDIKYSFSCQVLLLCDF